MFPDLCNFFTTKCLKISGEPIESSCVLDNPLAYKVQKRAVGKVKKVPVKKVGMPVPKGGLGPNNKRKKNFKNANIKRDKIKPQKGYVPQNKVNQNKRQNINQKQANQMARQQNLKRKDNVKRQNLQKRQKVGKNVNKNIGKREGKQKQKRQAQQARNRDTQQQNKQNKVQDALQQQNIQKPAQQAPEMKQAPIPPPRRKRIQKQAPKREQHPIPPPRRKRIQKQKDMQPEIKVPGKDEKPIPPPRKRKIQTRNMVQPQQQIKIPRKEEVPVPAPRRQKVNITQIPIKPKQVAPLPRGRKIKRVEKREASPVSLIRRNEFLDKEKIQDGPQRPQREAAPVPAPRPKKIGQKYLKSVMPVPPPRRRKDLQKDKFLQEQQQPQRPQGKDGFKKIEEKPVQLIQGQGQIDGVQEIPVAPPRRKRPRQRQQQQVQQYLPQKQRVSISQTRSRKILQQRQQKIQEEQGEIADNIPIPPPRRRKIQRRIQDQQGVQALDRKQAPVPAPRRYKGEEKMQIETQQRMQVLDQQIPALPPRRRKRIRNEVQQEAQVPFGKEPSFPADKDKDIQNKMKVKDQQQIKFEDEKPLIPQPRRRRRAKQQPQQEVRISDKKEIPVSGSKHDKTQDQPKIVNQQDQQPVQKMPTHLPRRRKSRRIDQQNVQVSRSIREQTPLVAPNRRRAERKQESINQKDEVQYKRQIPFLSLRRKRDQERPVLETQEKGRIYQDAKERKDIDYVSEIRVPQKRSQRIQPQSIQARKSREKLRTRILKRIEDIRNIIQPDLQQVDDRQPDMVVGQDDSQTHREFSKKQRQKTDLNLFKTVEKIPQEDGIKTIPTDYKFKGSQKYPFTTDYEGLETLFDEGLKQFHKQTQTTQTQNVGDYKGTESLERTGGQSTRPQDSDVRRKTEEKQYYPDLKIETRTGQQTMPRDEQQRVAETPGEIPYDQRTQIQQQQIWQHHQPAPFYPYVQQPVLPQQYKPQQNTIFGLPLDIEALQQHRKMHYRNLLRPLFAENFVTNPLQYGQQ